MKTLYLLRHAKAEPGSKILSDKARPLAVRGHEACAAMGAYMKEKAYSPEQALCSSSVRTRETCAEVLKAAGIAPVCHYEDRLYLAGAEEIITFAQGLDAKTASMLIVGHNPGMHHVSLLLSSLKQTKLRGALELKYPTCSLAVLHFTIGSWTELAPGKGELVDFVTPEEL